MTKDDRLAGLRLGTIHLIVGIVLTIISYITPNQAYLAIFNQSERWSLLVLFALGIIKATYVVGINIPAATLMVIAVLAYCHSYQQIPQLAAAIWLGTMVGLAASYGMGWLAGRHANVRGFKPHDLVFALYPTLASIHFFEEGYWRRRELKKWVAFGGAGFVILLFYIAVIYSFKDVFAPQLGAVSLVVSVMLTLYGLWIVVRAWVAGGQAE
ncbi:MAG TPA: hypothetical protein VJS64_16115 [Pyrinomonadaceae bacterium]|nr:hypothetical protein [Pyrinomonadaceae bacterium]